jgi:hypothetical protein
MELRISAMGLENALRGARDGVTFFGAVEKSMGRYVNDFVIPVRKDTPGDNKGRFFCISYAIEPDCYMIRDLDNGFGTFVKVSTVLQLKDNHLI